MQKVDKIIEEIDPDGATNLWDGLDKGINEAIMQQSSKMNISLFLFTDGQPNVNPPMGLIPTLKEKLDDINVFFSMSTFGYGYNIDSSLMEEISKMGNGVYGYIPDASMVGTIFINSLSNLVSIISPLNKLTIKLKGKKKLLTFIVILYNGSSTNVMISLKENEQPEMAQINLEMNLTKQTLLVNEIKRHEVNDSAIENESENEIEYTLGYSDHKHRKKLIDLLGKSDDDDSDDDERKPIEPKPTIRKLDSDEAV